MQTTNFFQCGRFQLSLERPLVMGIINMTPDSFFDGNRYNSTDLAIEHALKLVNEGADILDIGGESTRPGFDRVSDCEERKRILPMIEALRNLDIPLSVDTSKPSVMKSVLDSGADMINDVNGFSKKSGFLEYVFRSNCGLCVVHNNRIANDLFPSNYLGCVQSNIDLINQIKVFFEKRERQLLMSGVNKNRIVFDPGFGFGKTPDQNFFLIKRLAHIKFIYSPILVGLSRKSMIGNAIKKSASECLAGSIAAALACVVHGAGIIRVHDVSATLDALKIWRSAKLGKVDCE